MGAKKQAAPPPEAPPADPKPEIAIDEIQDSSAAKNAQRNQDRLAAMDADSRKTGRSSRLGAQKQSAGLSVG